MSTTVKWLGLAPLYVHKPNRPLENWVLNCHPDFKMFHFFPIAILRHRTPFFSPFLDATEVIRYIQTKGAETFFGYRKIVSKTFGTYPNNPSCLRLVRMLLSYYWIRWIYIYFLDLYALYWYSEWRNQVSELGVGRYTRIKQMRKLWENNAY